MSEKLLHIYGQKAWHDEVIIVGNKKSLKSLIQALIDAIALGAGRAKEVMVTDGEGYDVLILTEDSPWADKEWMQMPLPYTDEIARTQDDDRDGLNLNALNRRLRDTFYKKEK